MNSTASAGPIPMTPFHLSLPGVSATSAEPSAASNLEQRKAALAELIVAERGLEQDPWIDHQKATTRMLMLPAMQAASGRVRTLAEAQRTHAKWTWAVFLPLVVPIIPGLWLAEGRLKIAVALFLVAFVFTFGVPFLMLERFQQGNLASRMLKMPPPGTPISVDASGLSIADTRFAWCDVRIEAAELRAYTKARRTIAYIETLSLATPTGQVVLDVSAMINGQEVVDAVCNFADVAPRLTRHAHSRPVAGNT